MRRFSTSVAAFACLCLLALQLSGLHLHVDKDSDDAGLHGTHTHQVSSHDHSAEVDVQLLEQFVGQWPKIVAQVCYVFLLVVAAWIFRPTWSPPLNSGKVDRRLHWRPQLRAPPPHL
jgi:hypothetical protein